jgi:hypothetical protein
MRTLIICTAFAVYLFCVALFSQSSDPIGFDVGPSGSASWTSIAAPTLITGYARVQAAPGSILPSGMAIFSSRSGGVLLSEASVPISQLIASGRIYAETGISARTGIAIANPNAQLVTIDFYFTDANGTNVGQGTFTLGPNRQIAVFLNEAPFNGPADLQGSFTFTASQLVSGIALRGVVNERGEFFMATLPIADIPTGFLAPQVIPQFADGGGWITEVLLVNSQSTNLTGSLDWLDQAGQKVSLSGGYAIAPRSAKRYFTQGRGSTPQVGSIMITPNPLGNGLRGSQVSPVATGVYTYKPGGVTVTETGVPAVIPDTAFRLFVDNAGNFLRTGVAVMNFSLDPAIVNLELFRLDATSTGLSGTLSIPAKGQSALFLDEIPGFSSIPSSFQGVLRLTSQSSIAVAGLRGHYNERGDFLVTTTVAVRENDNNRVSSELLFPHFAFGGSYETQFVLFSPRLQNSSGRMYFFDQTGTPLTVFLR